MAFLKINNNPEKRRLKEMERLEKIRLNEMKQVALLTDPDNNKPLYEFIIDWNKALEIMGKSEFKEEKIYAPEKAQVEINERVYQHLKKNNGCSKSNLDILLNKGENGYDPLIKILPSSLSVDEIDLYCFNKEVKSHVESVNEIISHMKGKIEKERSFLKDEVDQSSTYKLILEAIANGKTKPNEIISYMKEAVEKAEFDSNKLFDFDAAIGSIDGLVSDFKYKASIKNETEMYKTAINFGVNLLAAIASSEAEELAKDEIMDIYNRARELIEKYAKKCSMETNKELLDIDANFNKKIKDFKDWALGHQDELYNAAIEKAKQVDRAYEDLKTEFRDFSLIYGLILEERENLQQYPEGVEKALKEIDNTFNNAYANADEPTRERMLETQNVK